MGSEIMLSEVTITTNEAIDVGIVLGRSDELGNLEELIAKKKSAPGMKNLIVTKKEPCLQPSLLKQLLSKN